MKIDRKLSSLLVSILLVSLLLSFIPQTSINPETTLRGVVPTGIENPVVSGSPHGSITIDGNGDFKLIAEAESWDGDGSEETPYIIEGFDFDRGGTDGSCIDIYVSPGI